ncbi:MAG: hypothetical protein ABFD60_09660 [Bryobacteraceae bacterium]
MLFAKVRDFFSLRDSSDAVTSDVHPREKYPAATQRVAGVLPPEPSTNAELPREGEELEAAAAEYQPPAGEGSSSPCVSIEAAPPSQECGEEPSQVRPNDAEDRLTGAAEKLAQSITECLDHFVLEASRQVVVNRDQFHIALSALTSIAGKVQDLDDRIAALSGNSKAKDRNYRELVNRLSSVEQSLEASRSEREQLRAELLRIDETLKAMSGQVRTQGTITWTLEQLVHDQAQKIEAQAQASESAVIKELEDITHTLAAHEDLIGHLGEAQSSLDQRLEQHAGIVESVQRGSESQREAWGKIAAVAGQVEHSFTATRQDTAVPEGPQDARRDIAPECPPAMEEPVGRRVFRKASD